MAKKSDKQTESSNSPTIRNRKAFHDYNFSEKVEAGLALTGTEVKSLRAGKCELRESYARVSGRGEVWIEGMNIATYPQAQGDLQHDPTRRRKALLHKRQIAQLQRAVSQKGSVLIPLRVYFNHGYAKVELGVGEGKRQYDKRQTIKKRQMQRDVEREAKRF